MDKQLLRKLAKRIKDLRKEKGYTQDDLSVYSNIVSQVCVEWLTHNFVISRLWGATFNYDQEELTTPKLPEVVFWVGIEAIRLEVGLNSWLEKI